MQLVRGDPLKPSIEFTLCVRKCCRMKTIAGDSIAKERRAGMKGWFNFRISESDNRLLADNAKACGLSKSAYLRKLLHGYKPKTLPPLDYFRMMKELKQIGNNLNQIAFVANSTGTIDGHEYHTMALLVRKKIREIEKGVLEPETGHDEDMGDEPS